MQEILRDYQVEMIDRLHQAWRKCQSVMVQMPTGTGKTHLMAEVIRQRITPSTPMNEGGVLIVAHRRELLEQIRGTLNRFGIDSEKVVVESVQKLSLHIDDMAMEPSLVVVDEAHHALAETYKMLWDRWPKAKFLGLTATPCRLSGEAFTDLFDVLLQSWSVKRFIKEGWLSDLDYVSVRTNSITLRKVASLNKRGTDGDYQTKQMANVLDTEESIEHLYRSYKKYADGKKGIVYAINVEHAMHIAAYYQRMGVRAVEIDAKTPAKLRQQLIDAYRQKRIDVLVNCQLFDEGIDCPEVEFIQLARPTLSLSKYLQQLGRGMRISKGKEMVTILDQVGLYLIFGLPKNDRDWQKMFDGRMKGKGTPLSKSNLTELKSPVTDKMLVNEEMFPIKERPGRIDDGIEVFREKGLFGIKVNGKVTCPAQYVEVEKVWWESKTYYAFATLQRSLTGNKDTKTVITMDGKDLLARMTGKVLNYKDDTFEYRTSEHGRCIAGMWDARYDRYYTDGKLEMMGGMQFIRIGENTYQPRGNVKLKLSFIRTDVLYNNDIVVIGLHLFLKNEQNRHLDILGFQGSKILVKTMDGTGVQQVTDDGQTGEVLDTMPEDATQQPQLRLLGLHRERAYEENYDTMKGLERRLRPYQTDLCDSASNAAWWCNRILLQVPAGTGKTFVAAMLIRRGLRSLWNEYGVRVMVVAHRPEVKQQISKALDRFGLGYDSINVVDIQELTHSAKKTDTMGEPKLIIIDEAHSTTKETYKILWQKYPNAKIIGLTSTPCGEDNKGLDQLFEKMIPSASIKDFIKNGWLKGIKYVSAKDRGRHKTRPTAEELYQQYEKNARGKWGIVFAIDREHAQQITECYEKHGVKCGLISFDQEVEENERLIKDYEKDRLRVLVNVDYFSDGMKCPDAAFVQLACPTDSLTRYLHQVGCAMHINEDEEGMGNGNIRQTLTVIDHVGMREKFGLPTDKRDWMQLYQGKTKPEKKKEDNTMQKQQIPIAISN